MTNKWRKKKRNIEQMNNFNKLANKWGTKFFRVFFSLNEFPCGIFFRSSHGHSLSFSLDFLDDAQFSFAVFFLIVWSGRIFRVFRPYNWKKKPVIIPSLFTFNEIKDKRMCCSVVCYLLYSYFRCEPNEKNEEKSWLLTRKKNEIGYNKKSNQTKRNEMSAPPGQTMRITFVCLVYFHLSHSLRLCHLQPLWFLFSITFEYVSQALFHFAFIPSTTGTAVL